MPICRTCGHDLPSSFFSGDSEQCPACRSGYSSATATVQEVRPVARRRYPPVTTALIALNAAVFVLMVLSGISAINPDTLHLLSWGALYGPLALGSQPWRILTSNYLHGGIIHIALNMWCLWNLGWLAERIFERWTYVLVYTGCGIGGSIASLAVHPTSVGVGASGAIFGLAGALIAALYMGKLPVPKQAIQGTLRSLLAFAGYNLFFGTVVPFIDNSAHVGGFVTGLALGAALAPHIMSPPEVRHAWRRWVLIGMALVLFAAFIGVKKLRGGVPPLQAASQAFDHGDYDAAVSQSKEIVAHAENDAAAHALLGASYLQKKQFDQAEESLKRALSLRPKDAYTEYWLGVLYETTGRHEEGRKILSELIVQEPKNSAALVLLGYSLEKLERNPEAVVMYRRAVAADPKDPDAQRSLGSALLKSNNAAEALPYLQEALRLNPEDSDAEEDLAKAYAAQGKNQEAAEAFQKARSMHGRSDNE